MRLGIALLVLLLTTPALADWMFSPNQGWPYIIAGSIPDTADEMRCVRAIQARALSSIVQWRVVAMSAPSGTLGVAIYSEDGLTQWAEATRSGSWTADTGYTMTMSSWDLPADTFYLHCSCLSTTTGTFATVPSQIASQFNAIMNNDDNRFGVAGNPCVSGDPPDSVGGLTEETGGSQENPAMVVFATTVPSL